VTKTRQAEFRKGMMRLTDFSELTMKLCFYNMKRTLHLLTSD